MCVRWSCCVCLFIGSRSWIFTVGSDCTSVCVSGFWMSACWSISLSFCLPPHLLPSALWPLSSSCLGLLLLARDKLASRQPVAICHSNPFCPPPVSCLLLLLCPIPVCPMGSTCKHPTPAPPHLTKPFPASSQQSNQALEWWCVQLS